MPLDTSLPPLKTVMAPELECWVKAAISHAYFQAALRWPLWAVV
jgi:hypothetical protein